MKNINKNIFFIIIIGNEWSCRVQTLMIHKHIFIHALLDLEWFDHFKPYKIVEQVT